MQYSITKSSLYHNSLLAFYDLGQTKLRSCLNGLGIKIWFCILKLDTVPSGDAEFSLDQPLKNEYFLNYRIFLPILPNIYLGKVKLLSQENLMMKDQPAQYY